MGIPSPASRSVLAAVTAGDEAAFASLADRHRRELHVHCYRMLGSFQDSEDAVQETFLRAWRKRSSFQGRSTFRAWLYGIATRACLDALEKRNRTLPARRPAQPLAEIPWLQAYPDRLLDAVAPAADEPEAELIRRETIELAFIAAIQLLPPRQRAILIARDVLGWSATESAALLDVSVAAANSALQRARATLREHLPPRRQEWAPGTDPTRAERELLQRYVDANDRGDSKAMVALLREDALFAMPPHPEWWVGREEIVAGWVSGGFGSASFGEFRSVPTRANRQPAVAAYLRRPGEQAFQAVALDVLRIEDGLIAEVVTFPIQPLLESLGFPETISGRRQRAAGFCLRAED